MNKRNRFPTLKELIVHKCDEDYKGEAQAPEGVQGMGVSQLKSEKERRPQPPVLHF